jgi:hypothetical protein
VGLKRAWVFSCDGGACSRFLIVHGDDPRLARLEALDYGWETVLRDDGGPVSVTTWFCPLHEFVAKSYVIPDEDHEEWCPRRTRHAGCSCEVSKYGPHVRDDALGGLGDRDGKKVDVVVVPGEIL